MYWFKIFCLFVFLSSIGCNQKEKVTFVEENEFKLPSILLDSSWLNKNLQNEKLLILDARTKEEYLKGHIPGAVNFPVFELNSDEPGQEKNLKNILAINKLFSLKGISTELAIIVYADQQMKTSSRLFWALELHGHENCGVLNGGYDSWAKNAYKIVEKEIIPKPTQFITRHTGCSVDKLEVNRALIKEDVIIVDSRSESEYDGKESKGKRKGHIPTAQLYSAASSFSSTQEGCFMKSVDELKTMYSSIDKSKKVYLYCNSGRSATVNYLAMRMLGVDAAVYDGSWLEWSADEKLPVTSESKEIGE